MCADFAVDDVEQEEKKRNVITDLVMAFCTVIQIPVIPDSNSKCRYLKFTLMCC